MMSEELKVLYTTRATAIGGRDGGSVSTDDGRLSAELELPPALGGAGGPGTNPEQLFAAGYSACFLSALHNVGSGTDGLEGAQLTAEVAIGTTPGGDFGLAVILDLDPGTVEQAQAAALMRRAHALCPYSRATAGNIDVALLVRGQALGVQ
jgi:lipoyl-dependent peroxiredoxin